MGIGGGAGRWVVCMLAVTGVAMAAGGRRVVSAAAGEDGRVAVRWADGTVWMAPREPEQAGVEAIKIAGDGETVGWTVNRDECCQSYPIPMVLVLARGGRVRHRVEVGLGIFDWTFEDGGRRFAIFYDTAHGDLSPTCELYETAGGRRLRRWTPGRHVVMPGWARPFAKDVGR